jgi:hypothetical protein
MNIKDRLKTIIKALRPENVGAFLRGLDFSTSMKRLLGQLFLIAVIAVGGWAAYSGLATQETDEMPRADVSTQTQDEEPTPTPGVDISDLPPFSGGMITDNPIGRRIDVHTVFPTRPRLEIISYEVKDGDTLFGIAISFGLKPESILWGNFDVLEDNPHSLQPEQVLSIPPIDGTLHVWSEGEGLSGVADFYGVTVSEILDWPGNNLTPDIDPDTPSIEPGTIII